MCIVHCALCIVVACHGAVLGESRESDHTAVLLAAPLPHSRTGQGEALRSRTIGDGVGGCVGGAATAVAGVDADAPSGGGRATVRELVKKEEEGPRQHAAAAAQTE